MGGGPRPNTNVPNLDVPKCLWRGGVRPNWDNVLKYDFFFEGIPDYILLNKGAFSRLRRNQNLKYSNSEDSYLIPY